MIRAGLGRTLDSYVGTSPPYGPGPTATHHSDGRNEYLLTETVLSADLVVNLVAVALMGFDETRLPKLFEAMNDEGLRVTAVRSIDDVEIGEVDAETFTAKPRSIDSLRSADSFVAHPGWQGHVN